MRSLTVVGICAFVALAGCASQPKPKPEDTIRNSASVLSVMSDAQIDVLMWQGCQTMHQTGYGSFVRDLMYSQDLTYIEAQTIAGITAETDCPDENP